MATQTDKIPQGLPNGRLPPKKPIPHLISFAPTPRIGSAPYPLQQVQQMVAASTPPIGIAPYQPQQSFLDGMKAAMQFERQLKQQQAALWNLLHSPMIVTSQNSHKQLQQVSQSELQFQQAQQPVVWNYGPTHLITSPMSPMSQMSQMSQISQSLQSAQASLVKGSLLLGRNQGGALLGLTTTQDTHLPVTISSHGQSTTHEKKIYNDRSRSGSGSGSRTGGTGTGTGTGGSVSGSGNGSGKTNKLNLQKRIEHQQRMAAARKEREVKAKAEAQALLEDDKSFESARIKKNTISGGANTITKGLSTNTLISTSPPTDECDDKFDDEYYFEIRKQSKNDIKFGKLNEHFAFDLQDTPKLVQRAGLSGNGNVTDTSLFQFENSYFKYSWLMEQFICISISNKKSKKMEKRFMIFKFGTPSYLSDGSIAPLYGLREEFTDGDGDGGSQKHWKLIGMGEESGLMSCLKQKMKKYAVTTNKISSGSGSGSLFFDTLKGLLPKDIAERRKEFDITLPINTSKIDSILGKIQRYADRLSKTKTKTKHKKKNNDQFKAIYYKAQDFNKMKRGMGISGDDLIVKWKKSILNCITFGQNHPDTAKTQVYIHYYQEKHYYEIVLYNELVNDSTGEIYKFGLPLIKKGNEYVINGLLTSKMVMDNVGLNYPNKRWFNNDPKWWPSKMNDKNYSLISLYD